MTVGYRVTAAVELGLVVLKESGIVEGISFGDARLSLPVGGNHLTQLGFVFGLCFAGSELQEAFLQPLWVRWRAFWRRLCRRSRVAWLRRKQRRKDK